MKKLTVVFSILLVIIISVPIVHYNGYKVYGAIAFPKSEVIEVDESIYRTPKDKPEVFIDYMEKQGWTYKEEERMGSMIFFYRGSVKAGCRLSVKEFYAEYKVDYVYI